MEKWGFPITKLNGRSVHVWKTISIPIAFYTIKIKSAWCIMKWGHIQDARKFTVDCLINSIQQLHTSVP